MNEALVTMWTGLHVVSPEGVEPCWIFRCPCGVEAAFPINGIPLVDTRHPCGDDTHWSVRVGKTPAQG